MVIGYLTMHFTFISLFLNMRTMGSKFWLGATVLISSTFSFLLALATVDYLGVPINMVLMSEGLPFLVVTVGFEKPFMLTKSVLQGRTSSISRPTKDNVTDAVREKGPVIVRDYLVEIAVLALGAASGVRGLRQFCFLAAWILGWDCVLLFTFYTAILSIKLEVQSLSLVLLTILDQSYQETYCYPEDLARGGDVLQNCRFCGCCKRSRQELGYQVFPLRNYHTKHDIP
jgi:hydroxymethylglutaryl-CoA reductase (NADPH)